MDLWAISQASFGYRAKQKLISKLAHDKTTVLKRGHGTNIYREPHPCLVQDSEGRTRCSGPWDPHLHILQAAYCSLLACPRTWEALSPAAPGTHLPFFGKRLLTSVRIRKTLGLQCLLPSLANLYANHILRGR